MLVALTHDISFFRVAVVDKAIEIVDRYHDRILELEQAVLIQPKMKTVRESMVLHIFLSLLVLADAQLSARSQR
jgi:hypothetical protein